MGSVVGGGRCGSVVVSLVGRSLWVSRLGSVAVGQSPEGRSLSPCCEENILRIRNTDT